MSRFIQKNTKRSRSSRAAAIGASSTVAGQIDLALRDRSLLLRLFLCLVALVALLVAVEGWKTPFIFRLGDHAVQGILAKIDFSKVSRPKTDQAVRDAERLVPLYFRNNLESLSGLPLGLRADLEEIVQAKSVDEVSEETRSSFGLMAAEGVTDTPDSRSLEDRFVQLRSLLAPRAVPTVQTPVDGEIEAASTAEDRIAPFVDRFASLIQPLERLGVAGPLEQLQLADENDVAIDKVRPEQQIAIFRGEASARFLTTTFLELLPIEILKESGLIGRSWPDTDEWKSARPYIQNWLAANLPVTLRFDSMVTQNALRRAREGVEPQRDYYSQNQVLIEPGNAIDEERLAVLRAEYDELERQVPFSQRIIRVVTNFAMILVLAVLIAYYLVRNQPRLSRTASHLSVYMLAIVIAVTIGRVLSFGSWRAEVIPVMATVMVIAIVYDQVLATLTAFTLSLILTLSTVSEIGQFVVLMSVSATSVIPLSRVSSRSTLIKVGFWTAIAYFFVSWGTGIMKSQSLGGIWFDEILWFNSLRGAACCLAAGYLVAGSLPFIESAFGVVTDISLLELSDISHPLLQELVRGAPGTYNHSVAVATMGEAAADRIGANGLLVRVGAYFHDIGKMLKPQYFVENLTEGSKSGHEDLAPAMSTLIIIGHVKDGVDLAQQHGLPQQIIDFVEQHHGTTLVQYFYHEAAKQADQQPDHRTDADEDLFRYPGPKPQTKETGVLMLTDAVESASRTLSDPTPKRIENLVHKITMDRLLDNQLEASTLTLSEVYAIEDSLTKSLIAIYHGRIKYPEQRSA